MSRARTDGPPAKRGIWRKHALTTALVFLAAAAGFVVFVQDPNPKPREHVGPTRPTVFAEFRRDDVLRIDITSHNTSASAARTAEGKNWALRIDGVDVDCDEQALAQFLGSLDLARAERAVAKDADVARAFDDSETATRIAIFLRDTKEPLSLTIGGSAPTPRGARYAKVTGDVAFVLNAELAAALAVDPTSLRSKRFSVPAGPLSFLSISRPTGERQSDPFEFKEAAGTSAASLVATSPEQFAGVRVNAATLGRLTRLLEQARIVRFLPDSFGAPADVPIAILRLGESAGTESDLSLWPNCPGHDDEARFLKRSPKPLSGCIAKTVALELAAFGENLVDSGLFGASRDGIYELTFGGPLHNETVNVVRKDAGWHMRQPSDEPADPQAVEDVLKALLEAKFDRFDGSAKDSFVTEATLVATSLNKEASGAPDDRTETVLIGSPVGRFAPVHRTEDDAWGFISASLVPRLVPSGLSLRTRQILNEPTGTLRSVRIVDRALSGHGTNARPRVQEIARDADTGFRLVEPNGTGIGTDLGFATELFVGLSNLTAERRLPDEDLSKLGLAPPRAVVEGRFDGGTSLGGKESPHTVILELGDRAEGGFYARKQGESGLFIAPKAFGLAVSRWALDRGALLLPVAKTQRFTFSAPHRASQIVERSLGGFRFENESGSAERAASLVQALEELVADEVAELGAPGATLVFDEPRLRVTLDIDGDRPIEVTFGAEHDRGDVRSVYVRRSEINATFNVERAKVLPIYRALGME